VPPSLPPSPSGPSLSASLAGEACGCHADLTADEERWLSRVTAERAALGSGETLLVQTHGSSRGRGRAVDGRETACSESSARLVGHSKAGHLSGQYAYVRRGMPEPEQRVDAAGAAAALQALEGQH
jgi:hypothetical protein